MIIQSSRLPASRGAGGTADHVLRGDKNERIVVIQGSEAALHDMVSDARAWRRTYAVRHFKVSPRETPTMAQLLEAVADLATEFGFAAADAVVVGHVKRRRDDAASEFHLHVLAPEVDPATGRVLSSRWSYPRQEKVARVLEARWGHAVVQGAFNSAVLARLRAEGRDEDACLLVGDGLVPGARPQAPYTPGLVQEVQRKAGRAMADVAQAVRDARLLSDTPAAFRAALLDGGLRLAPGGKSARWVVEALQDDGGWTFAGALHRLLKVRVDEAARLLEGWNPPALPPGGQDVREDGDAAREEGEQGVGRGRVRRAPGRPRRAGAPAGGRPAGDDAGRRRGARRGVGGEPADEPAGQPGRGGGRDGAGQRAGAPARAGGRAAGDQRAPERGAAHPVASGGAGRGREGGHAGRVATFHGEADSIVHDGRHAGRLRRLLEVAALEQGLRRADRAARLVAMVEEATPARLAQLPPGTVNRSIRCAEGGPAVRERHLRFRAMLLGRAYPLAEHLPPEAVLNLRRVDYDPLSRHVLLTLWTGTQLLDTGDRVTVRGVADDVTVRELCACVVRRGWTAVELHGDDGFRMAAAREMARHGIHVVDSPLTEPVFPDGQAPGDQEMSLPWALAPP